MENNNAYIGLGSPEVNNDRYSNLFGGYPPCLGGAKCLSCKTKCQSEQQLAWETGGKECYQECKASSGGVGLSEEVIQAQQEALKDDNGGIGIGTILLIMTGILALSIGGIYIAKKIRNT